MVIYKLRYPLIITTKGYTQDKNYIWDEMQAKLLEFPNDVNKNNRPTSTTKECREKEKEYG